MRRVGVGKRPGRVAEVGGGERADDPINLLRLSRQAHRGEHKAQPLVETEPAKVEALHVRRERRLALVAAPRQVVARRRRRHPRQFEEHFGHRVGVAVGVRRRQETELPPALEGALGAADDGGRRRAESRLALARRREATPRVGAAAAAGRSSCRRSSAVHARSRGAAVSPSSTPAQSAPTSGAHASSAEASQSASTSSASAPPSCANSASTQRSASERVWVSPARSESVVCCSRRWLRPTRRERNRGEVSVAPERAAARRRSIDLQGATGRKAIS